MKTLIVLRRIRGGLGRSNTEIAKVLRKRGHQIDFLSREDDLKIYSFLKGFFPIRKKIKQLMKKENYDLIYVQDWSLCFNLLFPIPIYERRICCCFCGRQKNILSMFQNYIGERMGKKLVVLTNQLKKEFPKSTVINRGVNLKEFKPLKKKREYFGWVDKGTEEIKKKEIKKIGNILKLKVTIAKNIPKNKMNVFYNKCKIFISLPHTKEYTLLGNDQAAAANNVWTEAMAAGVPIIIGNHEGIGKILPINKVLNDKNETEEIIKTIKNPKINYRKWLIDNGFSWERKVKELESFFRIHINRKDK